MNYAKIRTLLGIFFILSFDVIGAIQEVYLGSFFQEENPVIVTACTFGIATIFFIGLQLGNLKKYLFLLKIHYKTILGINFSTTISWLSFFVSLKYIEPAVSSVTAFAIGPIVATLFWKKIRPKEPIIKIEVLASIGIVLGSASLIVATAFGKSAVGNIPPRDAFFGIMLATLSGLGVIGNTFFSKKLSDKGLDAKTIMALRFFLLLITSGLLWPKNEPILIPIQLFAFSMLVLSILTIIIPLFVLQLGIARCESITTSLLLFLLPIFTYLIQLFDSRLIPSIYSLVGVGLCVAFTMVGTLTKLKRIKE